MSINSINGVGYSAYTAPAVDAKEKDPAVKAADSEAEKVPGTAIAEDTYQAGVKVEESDAGIYSPPKKLSEEQIEELKRQLYESMRSLAAKILGQQAEKNENSMPSVADLANQLGLGTTPETAAAAIAEDGAWGVDAVATRLINMAMALSGGDVSKAEELRAAVQAGFEEAEKVWGGTLPQICQDTYTETMNRFDYWVENGSMDGYGKASETETETESES